MALPIWVASNNGQSLMSRHDRQWFIVIMLLMATRLQCLVSRCHSASQSPVAHRGSTSHKLWSASGDLQSIGWERENRRTKTRRFSCCSATKWRHLWSKCKSIDPPKRIYICRARYHTTGNNHQSVDGLAAIPSQKVQLCMQCSVCCSKLRCPAHQEHQHCSRSGKQCDWYCCDCYVWQWRLQWSVNINVAAGLVNSATGTVVTVMYDNDDCSDLLTSTLQQVR